ncbi:uncharacterized protein LOC134229283 isoform X2 [Saccostrea cucullata]|uniref:uncharacterized protein LOC134229283 isoform X2 n=1 Tax=Saccostrea cuccullata TaxID=36930 RepID=UPI002ED0486F
MFGCVFFHEDTSLSVVGEKSKRLELLGSFQEGEKVNMKWGKDIFSGVIVYVHGNQDLLEAEAVKAEKKVLRGKNLSAEESVEQLITFFKKAENENQKKDGKRERIPTERAKESHEQDNEMSPKKKKKNTANEKKDDKTEKKDDGEKNNDEGKKKNDGKKNKAERKKKTEEKSKEKTELETPKEKERQEKKAESSVQLATAKEMLSSLSDQFGSPTASEDRCVDNTTLTSTWALCNPELERPSVTMSTTVPSSEAIRPPADVLELFKLLLRPQVQSYMRSMISQFQETESQVDETYSCLPLPTYTPMTPATWTQDCNYTQPSPWTQQLPVPAFEQQLQTQPTSNIHTQQMPTQQISLNSQPQDIETQQMSTHLSMPPQISLQQIPMQQMMPQQMPLQNPATPSQHTTPQKMPSTHLHGVSPPRTPRRSPRKHFSSTPEDSDGLMTRLLSNHPLTVKREALRKAKTAAKKAHPSKMAFTLTAKLLPSIFSCEELALSRGQGLKSKEGDIRPTLDSTKMTVLKEYVAVWCEKNGGKYGEKEINDAVTEQVSYARKKRKGNKKPVTSDKSTAE